MRAQCCICSDLFENSLTVNIAACPCGHTFHEECLMRWMDTSSTCPSCRTHVKKNQIIKRLFFDINEVCEDDDVEGMLNQISNLTARLSEKDKQRQELAESRDTLSNLLAVSEAERKQLLNNLNDEKNARDVMQRDLKLLRKENAAFIEEMKEFRKTQRRMQELQNMESLLKECDSDIQDVVRQYSEGSESSVKQLASLLTVIKREYNQVLSDKKVLREQVSKLKRSIGHYHSEAQKYKKEVINLRADMEKTNENLSQVEKDNNENRRKLVHLRNALRHNKTEGSTSFHRALNEDSPNVAYTPPSSLHPNMHFSTENSENESTCTSPDLFDDSPVSRNYRKRKSLEEFDGPKLKFANIPTASERLRAILKTKSETVVEDVPRVPHSMLTIMQKKQTDDFQANASSVITRGYDGFGGSTTFVHPQRTAGSSGVLKFGPKKTVCKKGKLAGPKMHLAKQPQISGFANASRSTSLSSSTLSLLGKMRPASKIETGSLFRSSSTATNVPKLTSDNSEFIDLT